ncbi:MAG TPA: hypothetical protein PLS51_13855 [Flavobacterium sp.]|nr:hypothetical protein [Flavobacterium sp.]HPJ11712.1 hypothetical protein [Flavobacterium sp.]
MSKQRRKAAAEAWKVSLQGERLSESPPFEVVLQIVISGALSFATLRQGKVEILTQINQKKPYI